MRKHRLILVPALAAALCACAPAAVKRTSVPRPVPYLEQARLDSLPFAPAPAPGSETDKAELALLHEWQEKRTQAQCAAAKAQEHAYYGEFFGGISPFADPLPAEAADFLGRVWDETAAAVIKIQGRYQRPRPFLRDPGLAPCLGRIGGLSYPSGHTTISRVFALILADLVPGRRAEFLARADEAALNRVIGGVHHPSDIEAGKLLAAALYGEYLKNPAFRADLESMRRHLAPREF